MELLNAATAFAKEKLEAFDAGHDWTHTERVMKLAGRIQEEEGAGDPEVIRLAAIFHDIADTKFHQGAETDGGEMAYTFLMEKGLPLEKAAHIRLIINHLSFKQRLEKSLVDSIEFRIVQDADRLDAMGAIGIARTFHYGGYKNRALYDPEIPPREYKSAEEYKKSDAPTINHFYEKLLLLKDLMNTATGKRMAQERHDYMVAFVERFRKEWEGRM
ncbi:MAG: HD domain-containing protein [Bacteroidales bacterium]|nr:HD domain-containing protein [Bacteroidales bacterium]MDT8431022.1 HD domain-containing protein [Bacteroidales bacterium]